MKNDLLNLVFNRTAGAAGNQRFYGESAWMLAPDSRC
jgi:hypothetical protein